MPNSAVSEVDLLSLSQTLPIDTPGSTIAISWAGASGLLLTTSYSYLYWMTTPLGPRNRR